MAAISSVQEDLTQIGKLSPKRKLVLVGLVVVLFAASILVGSYLGSKQQERESTVTTEEVSPTLAPSTTLSLSPTSGSLKVGDTQEVTVTLSKVPVSAVDIIINYDPEVFTVSDITNGEVFDKLIQNKVEKDSIIYSASVSTDNAASLKEGKVFTFTVTAKKSSDQSALVFDPTKTITALNRDNTLGSTVGGVFVVSE